MASCSVVGVCTIAVSDSFMVWIAGFAQHTSSTQTGPSAGIVNPRDGGSERDVAGRPVDHLLGLPMYFFSALWVAVLDSSCAIVLEARGVNCEVGQPNTSLGWRWVTEQ